MSAPTPLRITGLAQLRAALGEVRRGGKRIGLVPTMGALHEGHLSLVRQCRSQCDFTVVSIYVNPSQFGPGEDLTKYPRTLEADLAALAGVGAEAVFMPTNEEMYPPGYGTWVEVGSVAEPLEGQCRPGHFRGVATIVLKLFHMVGPDVACFGHKDYQQALVIQRMVRDMNVPIEVRVCPTVREPDGLAMSSRNAYLSPAARQRALVLWRSLCLARDLVARGERNTTKITEQMCGVLLSAHDARIDYVALVDPDTLEPVATVDRPVVAALAVRIENTRLIDNCLLEP
jgi:pantoate--beta-alanine ligase